ncbi:hypothetical protein LY28_01125 [Ruminiclostridium sufflavum DSM 19573]|uniref:Calcineurin-like phosphoesterase domain-containing protein n=1 Tax=Ruminiclostridium sufflavum DSM 19573 TaxID=1121337 RepID=A0A318XPA4_9FIRM|nr:metallophosphoesterase [Ruminiclostridium sufflavum]PYG88770.1 hypothetical protein LY28_01125 [Ruminiclostridium sufflavum DSM 19573]
MTYTIILIISILLLLLYMRIEASLLSKSTVSYSTSHKGLKIAHISDLHVNKLYISAERIRTALKEANPDIIIMSGDYIEKPKDITRFITLLREITAICPVYISLGNHDHKALNHDNKKTASFINIIQKTGAEVLLNSNISIIKNNTTYNIIGIDDLKQGKPDVGKAFSGIKPSLGNNCINVVFSHNPDMLFNLPEEKSDYFLCGHFHGGQIWMPFGLEFKIMRNEKLCKMGYRKGSHKINGINMYLNKGLGNVVFPFRFLSKPEIAVIQLP